MELETATQEQIAAELLRRANQPNGEPVESVASFLEKKAEELQAQAKAFRAFTAAPKGPPKIEPQLLTALRGAVAKMTDLNNPGEYGSGVAYFREFAPQTNCGFDEVIDLVAGVVRPMTGRETGHRDSFLTADSILPWFARISPGSYQVVDREDGHDA